MLLSSHHCKCVTVCPSNFEVLTAITSMELIPMDRINCKSQYSHLHPAEFPSQSAPSWATFPSISPILPSLDTAHPALAKTLRITLFCTEDLQGHLFCYHPDNNPLVAYTTRGLPKIQVSWGRGVHEGAIWRTLEILQEKSFLIHSWRAVDAKWMARIAGF